MRVPSDRLRPRTDATKPPPPPPDQGHPTIRCPAVSRRATSRAAPTTDRSITVKPRDPMAGTSCARHLSCLNQRQNRPSSWGPLPRNPGLPQGNRRTYAARDTRSAAARARGRTATAAAAAHPRWPCPASASLRRWPRCRPVASRPCPSCPDRSFHRMWPSTACGDCSHRVNQPCIRPICSV